MRIIFDIGLMRLPQQAPSADHNFVPHCLVPAIDLYAHVGALNMRVIFVIRMMRFQDRARSAVQHLIRPSSILVTEICAKVQTLEHVSKFEFLFDATP